MTIYVPGKLTLDNGTRPAAIAGVAPTLDYRFARDKREIETVSLLDKLTYTGGNGTFVGSDGYIQRATTNVPRFDHDPVSRVSEGLLVEGSRENLLLHSQNLSNAWWAPSNSTLPSTTELAPDGTATAVKWVFDSASSVSALTSTNIAKAATATTYTFSSWAKPAGYDLFRLYVRDAANNGNRAEVTLDVTAGSASTSLALGTFTDASTTITAFPNGWYRCALTFTTSTETSINVRFNRNDALSPNGTDGLILWGAQLEAASTPSTYIPTTSATVTRTADSAVIDGTGVLTGTYTIIAKPEGCAIESGGNIVLQEGYTAERVMVFPASLSAQQITDIRSAM